MAKLDGRLCSKCEEFLGWDSFNKNKKGLNGRKSICKSCTQVSATKLLNSRKTTNPDLVKLINRKKMLKSNYGLSLGCYELMLKDQEGECRICSVKPEGNLFVDHCHKSGEVRGLLCQHCNSLLGMAKDDSAILIAAIKYLKEYG